MKALTLTQPWASLIAVGAKRYETRNWRATYTGPLAIHAAKGFPAEAVNLCYEEPYFEALVSAGCMGPAGFAYPPNLPLGAIVAVVDLVECVPTDELWTELAAEESPELDFGDFGPGRWAWALANVRPLSKPVPCRGALGLWDVPGDVLARLSVEVRW